MTLFSRGLNWFDAKIKAAAGVGVVYIRGDTTIEPITAVEDFSEHQVVQDTQQFAMSARESAWLISVADLVADEVQLVPQQDDIIQVTRGGATETHVAYPLDGNLVYEYLPARGMYRIYTKQVDLPEPEPE